MHALAIVNPSLEQEAEVQLRITTAFGSLCDVALTVDPLHRLTRFLEDDPCETLSGSESIQGIVTVSTSGTPIAVSAMQFLPITGGFTPLPVERLED